MARPIIVDVLADRYASTAMLNIWSPEGRVIAERELWITLMEGQRVLGHPIPTVAINAYTKMKDVVDLASIRERELQSRHDVKARIEEFNALAGYEYIHAGMTSRDLTENVEQMQVRRSMELVQSKLVAILAGLVDRADRYEGLLLTGRTHNVPAQLTTLGKRFASAAEEVESAYYRLDYCRRRYPLRGIKGAVGTQQDMLDLLGSEYKVTQLEKFVADMLGFDHVLTSVGQVYPRTHDLEVVYTLVQVGAVASSWATTLRLMAGHGLVTEGFKEGQTGSSAMPHKKNARSSERTCGFYNVLRGYLAMIEGPAGSQWNEGDVSCSVVRRVALPGAFFALDGLLETWLTILGEFGADEVVIKQEVQKHFLKLASTKLLMAAVKAGMGREAAHACIEKHVRGENFLVDLAVDEDFPLKADDVNDVVGSLTSAALAEAQTREVIDRIRREIIDQFPEDAKYVPEPIL